MRIGLIADTHGLLRPEAVAALAGCACIVHAGDIGAPQVLEALAAIAPVSAVRGNNDRGAWADGLPEDEVVSVGDHLIYVLHDLAALDLDAAAAGFHVVVTGHSHRPSHEIRDGVHYINPGSAGPRRFRLPVTLAELCLGPGTATVRFVTLETGTPGAP
jgi:putative phosphoesterase